MLDIALAIIIIVAAFMLIPLFKSVLRLGEHEVQVLEKYQDVRMTRIQKDLDEL